jgi:hypothetical protein
MEPMDLCKAVPSDIATHLKRSFEIVNKKGSQSLESPEEGVNGPILICYNALLVSACAMLGEENGWRL